MGTGTWIAMSVITRNDNANNDDADTHFVVSVDVMNALCIYSGDSDNDKNDHDTDANTSCE